ncbi:MAG: hypothetical protein KF791_08425 [Verrucomicrobiae bacterium]|nr:hypothetical protein [Verrucomicrobiae bacterium]
MSPMFLAAATEPGLPTGVLWFAGLLAASGPLSSLVALVGVFATRREVEALERRINETRMQLDSISEDISDLERRLNHASEDRALKTHERINEILREISRLSGRFDQQQHANDHPVSR